jgi:hypothetical protein
MDFSVNLATELDAIATQPPKRSTPLTHKVGGSWCCPADARPMVEEEGRLACPHCDRELPGLVIYQLIEFHEHPR